MAAKTAFAREDVAEILAHYNVGAYADSAPIAHGTVQTNYALRTTEGSFVFRYYENRSAEAVLFESELLAYLAARRYPCPRQIRNAQGEYVGIYRGKPYLLFEFMPGQVIERPGFEQWLQLVQKAAELHTLTQHFDSAYTRYRWNYSPELCQTLAQAAAERLGTPAARAKNTWLARELAALDLPSALPKGVCHCDFHFSNVLFVGGTIAAVLDFDDANLTFLLFDLVGLIEHWAWPFPSRTLDTDKARSVVKAYTRHRELSSLEQQHLFDVYKLSILFDCVWYFDRGAGEGFYERRKIDALNRLGRQAFFDRVCGDAARAP